MFFLLIFDEFPENGCFFIIRRHMTHYFYRIFPSSHVSASNTCLQSPSSVHHSQTSNRCPQILPTRKIEIQNLFQPTINLFKFDKIWERECFFDKTKSLWIRNKEIRMEERCCADVYLYFGRAVPFQKINRSPTWLPCFINS